MSDFIVNPSTVSFTEAKNQMRTFLDSLPDGRAWRDFYDCGAGTTIIELIAGFMAFLQFNLISNRREVYLLEAKNLSSLIGLANNDKYSAGRGTNSHLQLRVTPNVTRSIEKFEVIGKVKDLDLVSLDDYALVLGTPIPIQCVVGNKISSFLTAADDSLRVFRFLNQGVSEDIRVKVGSTYVPFSKEIINLINDKYVVITNPLSSVDILYLNTGIYPYTTNTDITIEFIELKNLSYTFPTDVKFNYGTIAAVPEVIEETDTQIISVFQEPESKESIRINAPLYSETQKVIRGREDFRKIFKSLNTDFLDTNGRDVSPVIVELSYLKSDLSTLTSEQKLDYIAQLNKFTNYGVWLYRMSDPVQVNFQVNISLKAYQGSDISTVNSDITEIFAYSHENNTQVNSDSRLDRREKKLENIIDLKQIEHELINLFDSQSRSIIQIARVELVTSVYAISTAYTIGKFVTQSLSTTRVYECVVAGTSPGSLPTFPTTVDELLISGVTTWATSTAYSLNAYRKPTVNNNKVYKCIIAGTSSGTEPDWPTDVNDEIIDGTVTWKCIDPLDLTTADIPTLIVWQCHDSGLRSIQLRWNEFAVITLGGAVTWL
jgi:hypothetical protein